MPVPVALAAIASFIAKKGMKEAVKKYGKTAAEKAAKLAKSDNAKLAAEMSPVGVLAGAPFALGAAQEKQRKAKAKAAAKKKAAPKKKKAPAKKKK